MKVNVLSQLGLIVTLTFFFVGCGGGNVSRGTGWDINSKKGGFQYNIDFDDQDKFLEYRDRFPQDMETCPLQTTKKGTHCFFLNDKIFYG